MLSEVCLNGFLTAGVVEAAVWSLKRGQVGRSESERQLGQTSNDDNNNTTHTHTQKRKKKNGPRQVDLHTGQQPKTLVCFCVRATFVVCPLRL